MIGILIISHGGFGTALIQSASHVLGKRPPDLLELGVTVRDDPDAVFRQAQSLVRSLDSGGGVIVFTDMVGATPSNIASRLSSPGHVEIIAGVSLPMLVRALTYRNESLAIDVRKAISTGAEGVVQILPEIARAANGS